MICLHMQMVWIQMLTWRAETTFGSTLELLACLHLDDVHQYLWMACFYFDSVLFTLPYNLTF